MVASWTGIEELYTSDSTITANFELVGSIYTITYNLNGGAFDGDSPTQYNVESDTFTVANPTKEGYIFVGWVENEGDEPTEEYTIENGSTGNKTLTAVWKEEANSMPIIIGASVGGVALAGGALGIGLGLKKRKKKVYQK